MHEDKRRTGSEVTGRVEPRADDNAWLPSTCALCYASCSILAHRVNGVVVKIEGNPESEVGKGSDFRFVLPIAEEERILGAGRPVGR